MLRLPAFLAGEQVVGAIGSRVAYYATSASVGSATNVALEAGKNVSFDADGTLGSYGGAAASGALGGTGVKLLGQAAPSLANNIALGATTGFGGEIIAQSVDVSSGKAGDFNMNNIAAATVIGAGASAATPLDVRVGGLNAGRNNSVAIHNGLQTRLNSGDISGHQLQYSVEAGVGTALKGTGQGALGAAATGVYQKVTQ